MGEGLSVDGELLSYDGRYVRIDTENGVITVDYSKTECTGEACPAVDGPAVLRFAGSDRLGNVLMPALVEGYGRAKGVQVVSTETDDELLMVVGDLMEVRFLARGTHAGFEAMAEGRADIAMFSRGPDAEEAALLRAANLGDLSEPGRTRIVALDALIPVVSPQNQVRQMSLDTLARIFAGEITNWSELGGADAAILPALMGEGGVPDFGAADLLHIDALRDDVALDETTDALKQRLFDQVDTLALVPWGGYGNASPVTLRDVCGLRTVPRRTDIKTGDYPLTLPLYLGLPNYRLHGQALDFLAWTRTSAAQLVIRRAGFIDQGAVPIGLDAQGRRLASAITSAGEEVSLEDLQAMLGALDGHARLSTTFRFEEGSSALTAPSQSNLLYIAQSLRDGWYDGRTFILAGFSDGSGSAEVNENLSLSRAVSVLSALRQVMGGELPDTVEIVVKGYGEALPMGCDETEWGRWMNRRVELWIDD